MSDIKAEIQRVTHEVERAKAQFAAQRQQLQGQWRQAEAVLAHAEAEIKRYEQAPPGAEREHYLGLHRTRRQMILAGRELVKLLMEQDPNAKDSPQRVQALQARMASAFLAMKFASTDFQLQNYRPIARKIEAALKSGGTGALSGGTGPLASRSGGTGPLSGTGPLAARSGGTGSLAGTGPLAARSGGTGPLSAARPAPASPPAAPTGPLAARAASGPLTGGSGPLGAPPADLGARLAAAARTPEARTGLQGVLDQFRQLEDAFAALRNPAAPGQAALPDEQLTPALNKLHGQLYYLNRGIQQLGPLAQVIAFEPDTPDLELQAFMSSHKAPAAGAESASLTGRLKSFFGGKA